MMYRGNVYKYPVRSELHLTGYVFCWASYLVLCSPIVTTTITAIELVLMFADGSASIGESIVSFVGNVRPMFVDDKVSYRFV
jgi:hypothetical protein